MAKIYHLIDMKEPQGYLTLKAQRLPILRQIKELQRQLDELDKPFIEGLESEYRQRGWHDPKGAAQNEIKKMHKKFDLKY
jgi:hypothetical protein